MPNFWERADLWNAEDIRDAEYEVQCFALSERSRKLCLALLDSVSYADRYEGAVTQDEIDGWQADLAYQLMGENEDCAPGIDEDEDCTIYMPDALFIDYAPNDPFQTPDLVPDGYLFVPPWYSNPGVPLPGVLPTDAMVNFLAIGAFGDLGGLIASGLPRFHIDIDGEGEVELEFVKVPQGGNVLVVQDGDPLQQQVFDLNALQLGELGTLEDLFDIVVGESLNDTAVCEIHFATAGLHTIDVTFFPNIAADVIVGMGGGLRRVSLCGVAPEAEVSMPQFQVVDCVLQWRPNGSAAWADLVDLCAVQPPTIVRQDPTPPGNMQQDIGGAGYTDIADTDFVWRDGQHPMIGGLEIYPTADSALLTLKGVGSPYQTAKILRVQDSAGVDRAWINPRGDMTLNADAANYGLYMLASRIGLDNNQGIYWKDSGGTYRNTLMGLNGQSQLWAGGSGFGFYNVTGAQVGIFGETGIFQINHAGGTGASRSVISASPSSASSYAILEANDGASKPLFGVRKGGETFHYAFDAGTLNVFDTVIVGHESSATPGAGYGEAIKFSGKSSTTPFQTMARLMVLWETATHATRSALARLRVSYFGGEVTALEAGVTGAGTAKIGFLGITPQPRLAITGETWGIPALQNVIDLLEQFGLATDGASVGTPPWLTDMEFLPPLEVSGSWEGLEVGKALSQALAFNDYIIDLTDLEVSGDVVDRRCRATSVIRWLIGQIYTTAGFEMTYDNVAYSFDARWIDVMAFDFVNGMVFDIQDFMRERWAQPIYDEFSESLSPVVSFAEHVDELIAYMPTIEEAFYCSLTTNGILTSDGRLEFLDLMLATNLVGDVPQDIETWWYQFVRHFSAVDFGLFIAAALQTEYASTIDCSTFLCPDSGFSWCKKYNFAISAYAPPFVATSGDHVFAGTASGWKTDDSGDLRIDFPFPTNEVTIRYTVTIPSAAISVVVGADAGGGYTNNLSTAPGTYIETISIPDANRADGWYFEAHCNEEVCTVTLKEVYDMSGTGLEPTEGNNCD